MHSLLFAAIFLILAGGAMCALRSKVEGVIGTVLGWVGIVLVAAGLILIIVRPLNWLASVIQSAIGA